MITESHFGTGHSLTYEAACLLSLSLTSEHAFPEASERVRRQVPGKHHQHGWTALNMEQNERFVWSSTLTFNKNPSFVSGSWVTFAPLEHATHSYMRAWSLKGDLSTCSALSLRRHRQAATDPSLVSSACGCIILQCLTQVRKSLMKRTSL